MLEKFSACFWALNDWCRDHSDEDLRHVEGAMSRILDAWTDAMMLCVEEPTDEELRDYFNAYYLVEKF